MSSHKRGGAGSRGLGRGGSSARNTAGDNQGQTRTPERPLDTRAVIVSSDTRASEHASDIRPTIVTSDTGPAAARNQLQVAAAAIPDPQGETPELKRLGDIAGLDVSKVMDAFVIWDAESMIDERIDERIEELMKHIPATAQKQLPEANTTRAISIDMSLKRLSVQEDRLKGALERTRSSLSSQATETAKDTLPLVESLTVLVSMLQSRWRVNEKIRWMMFLDSVRCRGQTDSPPVMEFPPGAWNSRFLVWRSSDAKKATGRALWDQRENDYGTRMLTKHFGSHMKFTDVEREVTRVLDQYRNVSQLTPSSNLEALSNGIETLLQDPDVVGFMKCSSSGGLLIMTTQIEPNIELQLRWSSCLPLIVDVLRARPDNVVLLRSVELQHVQGDQWPVEHVLRSLCMQLMHWMKKERLLVDWMQAFSQLNNSGSLKNEQRPRLVLLLRELLLQLANAATRSRKRYTVVVVIEGAERLPSSDQSSVSFIIALFRAMCDEACLMDLGRAITFNYVFLYSGFNAILASPHPAERIAVLDAQTSATPTTLSHESSTLHAKLPVRGKPQPDVSTSSTVNHPEKGNLPKYKAAQSQSIAHRSVSPNQNNPSKTFETIPCSPKTPIDAMQYQEAIRTVDGDVLKLEERLREHGIDDVSIARKECESAMNKYREQHDRALQRISEEYETQIAFAMDRSSTKLISEARKTLALIRDARQECNRRYELMAKGLWMMDMAFLLFNSDKHFFATVEYPSGLRSIWVPPVSISRKQNVILPKVLYLRRRCLMIGWLRNYENTELLNTGLDSAEIRATVTVMQDDQQAVLNHFHARFKILMKALLENEDVSNFLSSDYLFAHPSRGLVVLGCDSTVPRGSTRWTLLTNMIAICCAKLEEKPDILVVKHFVGLRKDWAPRNRQGKLLTGTSGLLRSLCEQLLVSTNGFDQPLIELDTIQIWRHIDVGPLRSGNVEALCLLLRDLVLEIAAMASDREKPYTVFVAIDCINALEQNENASFQYVVDFLRALCAELGTGPLRNRFFFKYMLLAPAYSRLLECPHPLERLAICPILPYDSIR